MRPLEEPRVSQAEESRARPVEESRVRQVEEPHVRRRVAELVSRSTDGELEVEEIMAADCSLTALGVGSLAFLRLIDALEEEYGVQIDLAAPPGALDSLDEIVAHLGATR
ncbi:acyl carrier protein [Nonomuraea roseola]|uniref:Acyl carrier protein n=1 Tax=Nonomuraea roseola TaxID=46179 RepID=A0ABV5QBI5_9ACTN